MTRVDGRGPTRAEHERVDERAERGSGEETARTQGAAGWTPTKGSAELAKNAKRPSFSFSPLVWERVPAAPPPAGASRPVSNEEAVRRALEDQSGTSFGATPEPERPTADAAKVQRGLEQGTGLAFRESKQRAVVQGRALTLATSVPAPRSVPVESGPADPSERACEARYQLELRRYAPFDTFGHGFHGDGAKRGMRLDPGASHRVGGRVTVDMTEATAELELSQGQTEALDRRRAGTPRGAVSARETAPGQVELRMSVEGSNPLVPGAPDIDTHVDARLVLHDGELELDGQISGNTFPHAELILRDADGNAVPLDHFETSGDRNLGPFFELFGDGANTELSTFRARVPLTDDCTFADAESKDSTR